MTTLRGRREWGEHRLAVAGDSSADCTITCSLPPKRKRRRMTTCGAATTTAMAAGNIRGPTHRRTTTYSPSSPCRREHPPPPQKRVPLDPPRSNALAPFPRTPPPRRRRLVDSRAWQTSGPSWAQSPWNTRKARQSAVVAAGRGVGSAVCPTIGRGVLPRRRWRTILLRRHSGRRKCNSSSSSSSVGSVVSSSSSSPFSLPFSSS
mmetsp:Transcript_33232/g.68342  ORF Transcript_33232/g.68342 Transcript_33232/m.68342 type:complete len:205 (+) Transcript_33232:3-617(+)